MQTALSKSQYIQGKQCAKALWYRHHRKDLLPEVDDKAEARFESGREVGELARRLFPGGQLVNCEPWETDQSLQLTKELIVAGRLFLLQGSLPDINRLAKASRLKEIRSEIMLVQPGISVDGITNDQSMILGAAATYLKETVGIEIIIGCSK